MNFKYNILWLDDEPIKAFEIIREEYPDILFEKVDYIDSCRNLLELQHQKYHAVILDANGKKTCSPEKEANKSGFLKLVNCVIDYKLPLYIYSGQLLRASDGDTADVVLEELNRLGLYEKENIFFKSEGPFDMIAKIINDLNSKYQYYVGHEYLLSFFSNGWIKHSFKTEFLDPIMEYYYKNDYDSAHGNHMRNIIEQILIRINTEFKINANLKEEDTGRFRQIAEDIKNKKLDDSKAIHGPLLHMISIANERSHSALDSEERKLYFKSDFATFFIVAKWFNKLMTKSGIKIENVSSITKNNQPPQTHGTQRTGKVYPTYKENNQTYCNLKVKIPKQCQNLDKVLITGIKFSPYHETPQAFCCEPEE